MRKAQYSQDAAGAKLLTMDICRDRYKLSRGVISKLAEESNAVVKFGRAVRYDREKLDHAIDNMMM